jgi:hypothetical protein
MTTVLVLARSPWRTQVEGILRRAVLIVLLTGLTAAAQNRSAHWLHAGAMPPGAIGSLRLNRAGPLNGYFQPVRIRAPKGARIALAQEGGFTEGSSNDVLVGFQIGSVYRLQVSDIPNANGLELYPTIELIDRTYPPPCLALKFPVPIELTQEELELAAGGAFVTRVIYIEEPQLALPVARKICDEQPWIEAPAGEDPLVTADHLGRPIAILRVGGRVPGAIDSVHRGQCPPEFVLYPPPEPCPDSVEVAEPSTISQRGSRKARGSEPVLSTR